MSNTVNEQEVLPKLLTNLNLIESLDDDIDLLCDQEETEQSSQTYLSATSSKPNRAAEQQQGSNKRGSSKANMANSLSCSRPRESMLTSVSGHQIANAGSSPSKSPVNVSVSEAKRSDVDIISEMPASDASEESRKKQKVTDDFMNESFSMSMEEFEKHYEENYGASSSFLGRSNSAGDVINEFDPGSKAPKLDRIDSFTSERSASSTVTSPISKLNNLLQVHHGWTIVYQDISPPFTISATLTGPGACKIFESGRAHRNKKEARCAAARVALSWFQANLPTFAPQPLLTDWVSRLHQYVQKRDKRISFSLNVYAVGPFSFKCSITLKNGHTCGAELEAQPSKAKAKQEACRVALEYLTTGSGASVAPSPSPSQSIGPFSPDTSMVYGSGISISQPDDAEEGECSESEEASSTSQKVHELCQKLHIQPPSYHLTVDPDIDSLWSGYAQLNGPTVPVGWRDTKIAEINTVFGQKNAREQLAFQALQMLRKNGFELMANAAYR